LAPDAVKEKVAGDIARLTRLSGPLKQLSRQYGEGLLWTYASLESGVHVSYPGHGGYPTGYDPRQRPWYQMAKRAGGLTWMPVVDATTRQLTLTVSTPYRYPDGSFAGVVGMDLQIAFALAKDETTAGWSRHMSSFIIALERVAKGDFSVRLEARMKDERDPLIHAFNEIVPKIEEHLRMSQALGLAQEVQQSLLPQSRPVLRGFDIAGASAYCDETGGDYYDFIETSRDGKNSMAVVVGYVSGHGVPSALLMVTAQALVMLRALMPGNAAEIITDVNRHLSKDTDQTGNFMTFFYCELAERSAQIRWVRAGHDPALVYDPVSDTFTELKGDGVPLGLDDAVEYDSYERSMKPGQVIVIGTDGIWEATQWVR
jgi:hypothetical protein